MKTSCIKTQIRKVMPRLAALLCLTLAPGASGADAAAGSHAANPREASVQPKLAEQDIWKRWKLAHDAQETSSETRSGEGSPTRVNKASGLLGMDVRNQKGVLLGHIQDLVLDWKTEQVSYAVINTVPSDWFGTDGKLLAVPLGALTASPDRRNLILNADKSKVEAAMGFGRNNWPSVGDPSWGAEPFWQREGDRGAAPNQPAK